MSEKSNVFDSIWLIVPVVAGHFPDIPSFLHTHQWFCEGGGHILFKATRDIEDQHIAAIIKAAGCELAQIQDTGIYDAWNQAMDMLESQPLKEDCYVAFLGIDDAINTAYCLSVAGFSQRPIKPDFIYGNALYHSFGRSRYRASPLTPKLFGKDGYLFDVPHPGLMNKWGTIRKHRFDTSYQLAADFDFYIGIAHNTGASYKKINEIQSVIGSDGMSNSIKALEIYPREWSLIASRRKVKLNTPGLKIALFRVIASIPMVFNSLRRASWLIRGSRINCRKTNLPSD